MTSVVEVAERMLDALSSFRLKDDLDLVQGLALVEALYHTGAFTKDDRRFL